MLVDSLLPTDAVLYSKELKFLATLKKTEIFQVIVCVPVYYCITPTGIGNMFG